ncbi:MAG: HlyC/CorC family transporter [Acidobacteria bacterium]|nr:HlyC/CorC family transporter [Acidobacteriota bacterium]
MEAQLAGWLLNPVTLTLAGVILLAVVVVFETLSRRLAEMGNVRFQGLLDDHQNLIPVAGSAPFALSRLLDVLRWLEVGLLWLVWVVLAAFPAVSGRGALGLALLGWGFSTGLAAVFVRFAGEDTAAFLLRLVRPLVLPAIVILGRGGRLAVPPPEDDDDEDEASEREIQAFLDVGEAAGIFEGEEGEFVESLVDFFDTVVREVMTPRTEIVAVSGDASFEELMETFASSRKSRLPVYRDTIDHVVGVVHVKSLVEHLARGTRPRLGELMMECPVVPETKELGELLREFQQHRQQMAIVIDEYGGTAGLVTLEDILEEIVGEIQDEHEQKQPPEWEEIGKGVYRLQGRAPLEILEDLFGCQVEEEDVETVGGLVFSRYGTVPRQGVSIEDRGLGLEFTVEGVDDRRVQTVVVRRSGGSGGDDEDDDA